MIFGGSSITENCYSWIKNNLDEGKVIVEIGAGNISTKLLSERWKLFSIESNSKYVNYFESATYIYSPIFNNWYDTNPLKEKLPEKIDLLFIDGPLSSDGGKRSNVIQNYELFKLSEDGIIVVDDTYREDEKRIVDYFVEKHNFNICHEGTDEKTNTHQFTVLRRNCD